VFGTDTDGVTKKGLNVLDKQHVCDTALLEIDMMSMRRSLPSSGSMKDITKRTNRY
jgi:hypothetical protein